MIVAPANVAKRISQSARASPESVKVRLRIAQRDEREMDRDAELAARSTDVVRVAVAARPAAATTVTTTS
jgi:hypothetical protein